MKNLILLLLLSILMLLLCGSMKKTNLTPFGFLNGKKELIIHKARTGQSDTLMEADIEQICRLEFKEKDVPVEKIGTTPDRSVSILENGRRIVLLGIWNVDARHYVLNINHVEGHRFYRGYKIEKEKLEAVLPIVVN